MFIKPIAATKPSITDTKAIKQATRRAAWHKMIRAQAFATKATFKPFAYQGE